MIKTKKIIGCELILYDKEGNKFDNGYFEDADMDKLYQREKFWLSLSSRNTSKKIARFEYVDEIRELFYVDKKVGKRIAERMVKEAVEKKKVEYDTPWSTYVRIDNPEEIRLELWKNLALNIKAHFNMGRNEEYFLYGIISA